AISARVLGYKGQSMDITLEPGGNVTRDFTLIPNPLQIGEVVVTGAGTATETQKLGTVRNNVDSTLIQRSNENNVIEALAGKAPNVEVVGQSGDPGASSFIRIRGPKTIRGTGQPLIVVDGTPIDNTTNATESLLAGTASPNRASDLNPEDGANVEILTGAAEGASYGARAGQGVVLITTRAGSPGPTRYTLQSTTRLDNVNQGVPLQVDYGQGTAGAASPCGAPGCRPSSLSWGPKLAAGAPVYDHWDELFHQGTSLDNTLTMSGGTERTTFYLSGGYLNQHGMIVGPHNWYDRASVRLKAAHRLLDNLQVQGNISYSDVRADFVEKGSNISGLLLGGLRTPPDFNNLPFLDTLHHLQRAYRYPQPTAASATATRGYDNPFFVLNEQANNENVGRTIGNVNVNYLPISWLRVNYTLGADYGGDERLVGLPQTSSSFPGGQVTQATFTTYQIDHNVAATASYQLNPNVSGQVVVGNNANLRHFPQG